MGQGRDVDGYRFCISISGNAGDTVLDEGKEGIEMTVLCWALQAYSSAGIQTQPFPLVALVNMLKNC